MKDTTPRNLKPYAQRNERLRRLGFASYKCYLKSDLWKSIRERAFKRDKQKCVGCGKPARQAHHMNYKTDTLTGVNLSGVVSVCVPCHRLIELLPDGRKAHPKQVRKRLKALQAANSK